MASLYKANLVQRGNMSNFINDSADPRTCCINDCHSIADLGQYFGGIVRCDLIADGIIAAVADIGLEVPVVVRLEGNNADLGAKKLADSGLNIIAASGFSDAAKRIVDVVNKEAMN